MYLYSRQILFMLLLFLSVHPASGQLVAGFTASPVAGCAPLVVSFTNTTTPATGTTYVWNMGNGSGPVTLTNPGTSYLTAGTYTVTLTATNGSATNTFSRVITVYPAPTVQFNANDTLVCPGEAVTFTSATIAGVPGPVTYLWSSGDGYTSTNAIYSHAYAYPGYFNVTLNATNANGCSATFTKTSYVRVLTPPVPGFSASNRHICNPSGTVFFSNSTSGVGPFTYRWTFGDGSPASTVPSPSHFYSSPGSYHVKLVATDSRGCKDSITMMNYVKVSTLIASFTGPDSACVNTNVTFTNTSSGYTSSRWTYGDGNSSFGTHGSNIYLARGAYTVTLIVADSFCYDTMSRPFLVPIHSVNFRISPDTPCPAPVTASFAASVPPGSTVAWDFGDGLTGAGVNTTHTYMVDKYDTVRMIVTSPMGCRDTASKVYEIYDLIYSVYYPPLFLKGGCIPVTASFITEVATSVPPPMPVGPLPGYPYTTSYRFDFGDGSPLFDTIIVDRNLRAKYTKKHTYTAVGVYPVTVTITTANGCTKTIKDTIRAGTPHQATFTATPTRACYRKNEIKFTRTMVNGPIQWYYWIFGDHVSDLVDTVSEDPHTVIHHFDYPGVFSDTLISYSNGCPDTFIRKDYITIDSPKAIPQETVICSLGNTVRFRGDLSLGADSYTWLFGDGGTSTLANPTHVYPAQIRYTATLIVYNIASGCHDTEKIQVDLSRAAISFTASDTTVCKGDYVTFTATPPPPGHIIYYVWQAPGVSAYYYNSIFVDTFHTPGNYTIRLIVENENRCKDTITRTNYIDVTKPDANFTASPTSFCAPQSVLFSDASTPWPGTTITNYSWLFGDGGSASTGLPSVSHTFITAGTYNTREIITDNNGCKDTVSRPLVTVYKSQAMFTANKTFACALNAISFTNASTPAVATYLWTFGDGATSTVKNPVHAYTDTGRYSVRLIVTDTHGCRDTLTRLNYITISTPYAAFTMSDSISVCPPFTVRFTNTSSGGVSNYWDFGNGNTSTAVGPANIYTTAGYDTVRLIVTNSAGCKDTATGHVKVYGYAGAFRYSIDSGCAPLSVFFDADLSSVSLASSITWDFADGVTSTVTLSDTSTHVYLLPGAYVPKLILRDHVGCVSSSIGIDTIKVNRVDPGFSISPNPVCLRTPVLLTDTSSSFWSNIAVRNWTYNSTTSTLPSPAVTYTATGTYTVTLRVTDGWGCTATTSGDLVVYGLPDIISAPDSIICTGGTIALSDSAAGGLWSSGNNSIATIGSTTGVVTGIAAGVATITYATGATCYTTANVTVNAFPDPGIITGNDGVCVGRTITLADTAAGGVWSTSTNNTTITLAGLLTGVTAGIDTIKYTVTNVNCPAATSKIITVHPLPDAGLITGQSAICNGAELLYTETFSGGKWTISNTAVATIDSNTGVVRGKIVGNATITYTTAPDANGCVNSTTFPLSLINTDFTVSSSIVAAKCYGGADGSIALAVSGGAPPFEYLWSNGSTSPAIENLKAGTYAIRILETRNQCALSDSFEVTSPDSLHVASEINNDVCFRPNGRIKLTAAGGTTPYQYYWSNGVAGSEISGVAAGEYKCTLTDLNGCLMNISILLENKSCPEIVINNGISPNGDGINDTWIIEGIDFYPESTVQVFDKFGDKIFEQTGYKNDWGGTTGKGAVPDGTYYYLVKLNSNNVLNGRDSFTGSLLIKR